MSGNNGTAVEIGQVHPADIVEQMQGAYLDYAMSVIVSRALPDVRDGLKPVHRRILYAMYHDLGLDHTKPHKKSARIVGEVLGKYHPHGDTAVYDAMVRMAQPFSLRYPLIDGQGNFGSVDGDNAAAMRYTEARLAEISQLMLADLEKDTVDWHDNFDNSLHEPDVLPAALPNLLINGSSGIAVGMATNVPPHNLGEIVDALAFMLDNQNRLDSITVEHLMKFVKGPDFPTGGIVYRYRDEGKDDDNVDVIAQGYSVGRGHLIIQAKAHFEEMSRSRSRIVVTELPYQTNKVALLERIAALVRDGKIEGITDLRDESDRSGMRVVIELTRNVEPKDVLADLFKLTPLQQTFGMQMLALVNGEPIMLGLKRMLQLFINHRLEVLRRRSEYELQRARDRAHILQGLLKALDILDDVIATIRRSRTVETARTNLCKNFDFTQIQAQAILDMQLRRLAALERRKLQDEYDELLKRIAYLEDLLAHPEKMLAVIKEDLLDIKERYGDARRTQIVDRTKGTLTTTDLLPDQSVWVSVDSQGDLRRFERTRVSATTMREVGKGSGIELLAANTRDFLYLFAKDGQCRRVSIHEIPPYGENKHAADLTEFTRRDDVTAALALPRIDAESAQGYLFLVTENGIVKRVTLQDFLSAAAMDPVVMNVDDKDRLRWVLHTQGEQEMILVSASGQSIRFDEEDVRSMGLAAGGVGGMRLKKGDKLVSAHVVAPAGELVTITELGFAKRSDLEQYSKQGRNGGGIVTHKTNKRTGAVSAAYMLDGGHVESLVAVHQKSNVSIIAVADIPQTGRSVQGKNMAKAVASNPVIALQAATAPLTANDIASGTPDTEIELPETPPDSDDDNAGGDANGRATASDVALEERKPSRSRTKAATTTVAIAGSSSKAKTSAPLSSRRRQRTQASASQDNASDAQQSETAVAKTTRGSGGAASRSRRTGTTSSKTAAPTKAANGETRAARPSPSKKAAAKDSGESGAAVRSKSPAKSSSSTSVGTQSEASAGSKAATKTSAPAAKPSETEKPAEQMTLDMEIEEASAEKKSSPRRRPAARKTNKLSTVISVKKGKK
jgi:DNA gyrase subunit A